MFCEVGDLVEFFADVHWNSSPGNGDVKAGNRYEVIDLIGAGWDLRRISGNGPEYLRIMNSKMREYVIVVSK